MSFDPAKYLTNLKGKDYLEVKWRLVWFREKCPSGAIRTEHITINDQVAIFRAEVLEFGEDGRISNSATGHGSETPRDFGDYIEKAETKAIGRALAALGYGTQFAPELDEGGRIVDTPVQRPAPQPSQRPQSQPEQGYQPRDPRIIPNRPAGGITEKQVKFARDLQRACHIEDEVFAQSLDANYGTPELNQLTKDEAKNLIDRLFEKRKRIEAQREQQQEIEASIAQSNGGLPGMPEPQEPPREWTA
jgi:hypothetical protein